MKIITFEGVDHSGKSTQAIKLYERLISEGKKAFYCHFPRYETAIGKVIKNVLDGNVEMDTTAFQMLYAADQTDFVRTIITLRDIEYVVLDRYDLSTITYYLAKEGLSKSNFEVISGMQEEIIKPDLTFIFDIDVNTAMNRNTGYKDKHESDKEYLNKVCNIYNVIDEYYNNAFILRKFIHIDATRNIDEIAEDVYQHTIKRKKININYK